MTLSLLKITGHLLCRMPLNLGVSDIFSWLDSYYLSLAVISQKCTVFSLHSIRWRIHLICPITDYIHFDYFSKMVSDRFFHCKVTLFSFCNEKFCGEVFCSYVNSSIFVKLSIYFLCQYVLMIVFYFIWWVIIF